MNANDLKSIYRDLSCLLDGLSFAPPTSHVYNPLNYARNPAEQYLDKAGASRKKVVFLGMNPGPWGMAQTGVPFGSAKVVREWLGIEGPVDRPAHEHPRRPVRGFAVNREEVSGARLWGWVRNRFGSADRFFEDFFVANYCPLVFMEASGRNRTPDKLPASEKRELFRHCDRGLFEVVKILAPECVVGIGKFAEDRARSALARLDVRIGRILHPSPASPAANRGWARQADKQLAALGIDIVSKASG